MRPRPLTPDDVARAGAVVSRHLRPTPLRRSFAVPAARLKLECWQPTGSFKVRGAINILASLSAEERRGGVVAASAGNHALGVALAAEVLAVDFPVTLFVPESAPSAKVEKLRRFPVTVRVEGGTYDQAQEAALRFAERTGATDVHAFDDPRTAAGQGSVALELLAECPDLGTVVVPVGGGGLIASMAVALKAARPEVRVVAVQPEASPALAESLRAGRALLDFPAGPTLADGLAGGIGETVFLHRELIDEVVVVREAAIAEAIVALLTGDQVVAEGSGAIAAAAVREGQVRDPAGRPLVAVITGANIDAAVLARLLAGGA